MTYYSQLFSVTKIYRNDEGLVYILIERPVIKDLKRKLFRIFWEKQRSVPFHTYRWLTSTMARLNSNLNSDASRSE